MAIASLKYKSLSSTLTAPAEIDLGGMIPLMSTTLSSTASSVTFTSIPQSYEHLQIRYIARDNRASVYQNNVLMVFNSDTSNNYAQRQLEGNGSTSSVFASTSRANISWAINTTGAAASSEIFMSGIADILDYTSTNKNKTVRAIFGFDRNGAGQVDIASGLWFKTPEAITSITLTPEGTSVSFVANTHFALYGIKRAGV